MHAVKALLLAVLLIRLSFASDVSDDTGKSSPATQLNYNDDDLSMLSPRVRFLDASSSTGKKGTFDDKRRSRSARDLREGTQKHSAHSNQIIREPNSFTEYICQSRKAEGVGIEDAGAKNYRPLVSSKDRGGKRRHAHLPRFNYQSRGDDKVGPSHGLSRRARSTSARDLTNIDVNEKDMRHIWEENVKRKIENIVFKLTLEQFDKPEHDRRAVEREHVCEVLAENGVATTGASRLLLDERKKFPDKAQSYLRFLGEMKSSPEFLDYYDHLEKGEKNHVESVLGANLKFIRQTKTTKQIKKDWHESIDAAIHRIEQNTLYDDIACEIACATRTFINLDVPFDHGFDNKQPISLISIKDVAESFRAYLGENEVGNTEFFEVNGESVAIPNLLNISETKRPYAFLLWLLQEVESRAFGSASTKLDDAIEKMRTFKLPDASLLYDFFVVAMSDLERSKEEPDLQTVLMSMREKLVSEEYACLSLRELVLRETNDQESYLWHGLNLAVASQTAEERAAKIVANLTELALHQEFEKEIATYNLIRTLSINAFSSAEQFLRTDLFSLLSHNCAEQPLLKKDSEDIVRFSITVDPKTGEFNVTRRYLYTVKLNKINYGKFELAWQIDGNLESSHYRGTLRGVSINFADDCPIYLQYYIMRSLAHDVCFDFF